MKNVTKCINKLFSVVTTLASAGVGLLIVAGQRNIYFSRILRNVNEYHLSLSGVTIAGVAWVLYTYKTS